MTDDVWWADPGIDVAIVGYGPVGQALALLLGRRGHRVVVFERFREHYPLPRAVHLDHEIMRLLQLLGVADELLDEMIVLKEYEWFGADGQPLLTLASAAETPSGWASDYLFVQPMLEAALDRRVRAEPNVTVARGWAAERLTSGSDGAELHVRRVREGEPGQLTAVEQTRTVNSKWVIGADGANSFVRNAAAIAVEDFGFREPWLVIDVEPNDPAALAELPIACQWCDPRRPTTHVQSGPRQHRWEFMLLPGETAAEFEDSETVWGLLEPWCRPGDGQIVRSAVYEFRSLLAARMRDGRVLLAGDAAHQVPPVLGQGLCSGLRDAANIAWKLDLVLRGVAPEALLDSIDLERRPHNRWVIDFSVQLGSVLCQIDPQAAGERDRELREAGAPPPLFMPPLTDGILHRPADREDPLAGQLGVQGRVARSGRALRSDDASGSGFALIVGGGDPLERLSTQHRTLIQRLKARAVSLEPEASGGVRDLDGRLTNWLSDHDAHAVLVRPDFYVFGSASSPAELPALVDDLRSQLQFASTPAIAGALT